MSPRTKLIIGGVVNFALLVNPILAQLPPISFESPTYVTWDPIDSYDPTNWHVQAGEARIGAAGSGYGGGQSLVLPKNSQEAWLRRDITWNAAEQTAFIDFKIKPAADPEGSLANFVSNGSQLAFQVSSSSGTGQLWAFSGGDGGGSAAQWFLTPGAFPVATGSPVSSSWMRVTLRHDYARNLWDLFIDGKLAAVNLAFEGRGPNLGSLEFFGSRHGDTNLDDLSVDPENMLFPDADKDGLPDAWEIANGSNPNVYDRDAIKPGTGKSFLDTYLDSLWPPSTPVANGLTGIGSLGTIPPLTIMGQHQPVGALKGAFSVGGDGSASYSIPIDLPKGTGGMEPKISLGYSSGGGNGIAGLGWGISGFQKITRGPKSAAKEGSYDPVDFDADDRFFLDGEKLICVAGSYGAAGSEYRTEIDSFARITAIGNGPVSWKVETKAGLIVHLGATADSKQSVSQGTLAWGVNRVQDTVGNYYDVEYTRDSATGQPFDFINDRVAAVHYTGHVGQSLSPYCHVYFDYEGRPDTSRAYTKYAGYQVTKRLSKIRVTTGSYTNHSYQLAYASSYQTGRSLLTGVTKLAEDDPQKAIPTTTFQYDGLQEGQAIWADSGATKLPVYGSTLDATGEVNSMVTTEDADHTVRLTGDVSRAYPIPGGVTLYSDSVLQFDFKSDKLTSGALIGLDADLVIQSALPTPLFRIGGTGNIALDSGNYFGTAQPYTAGEGWKTFTLNAAQFGTGVRNYLALMCVDNSIADGTDEVLFRNVKIYRSGSQQPADVEPIAFNIGNQLPRYSTSNGKDLGVTTVDINGDGLPDLSDWRVTSYATTGGVLTPATTGNIYMNTGNGFTLDNTYRPPASLPMGVRNTSLVAYEYNNRHHMLAQPTDIDKDGNLDLLGPVDATIVSSGLKNQYAFFSWNGTGWVEKSGWRLPFRIETTSGDSSGGAARDVHFEWIDLNSDGYADFVLHTSNFGRVYDPTTNLLLAGANTGLAFINRGSNGPGWDKEDSWILPEPLATIAGGARKDLGRKILDLDGDGILEIAEATLSGSSQTRHTYFQVPTGTYRWNSTPGLKNPPVSPYDLPHAFVNADGISRGISVFDCNGDGLPDVLKYVQGDSTPPRDTWINRGSRASTTWFAETVAPNTAAEKDSYVLPVPLHFEKDNARVPFGHDVADLNGDGLPDILYSNLDSTFTPGTDNLAILNTGNGWLQRPAWGLPGTNRIYSSALTRNEGSREAALQDLNGDGFPDLITGLLGQTPKLWLNQCRPEVLTSVTDGFNSRIEAEYHRLNDPSPTVGFGTRVYEKATGPLPAGHVAQIDASLVVSRYSEPDGMGGRRYKSQRYGDLRYDRFSEVSLGFGWTEVVDELNGQRSRTETMRAYPFMGSPAKAETFVHFSEDDFALAYPDSTPGLRMITRETAQYAELPSQVGEGGTIRRPVQTRADKWTSDMDGSANSLGTLKLHTITEQLITDFDSYGFVKKSTVTSLDGATVVTESDFNHIVDANRWFLGRLSGSTVTKSGASKATLVKTAAFTYSSTTGLLESETVQPGHPLSATKTYTHDGFGNVVFTAVTASGQSRSSGVEFDSRGRFAVREENQLGHAVTHQYDGQKALLLSSTDIAGKTSWLHYDAFGTLIRTDLPDGTQTGEITGFATNASLPASIAGEIGAHQIKYFRAKESSGAPVAKVYLDAMGRELVTETTILRDATASGSSRYSKVYSITQYDARGRKILVSLPFAEGEEVLNTQITYDSFDRIVSTLHPDWKYEYVSGHYTYTSAIVGVPNQQVSYSNSLSTNGTSLQKFEDEHGRIIATIDSSNSLTVFEHDHEGRLVKVKLNGVCLLTNTYDVMGNKTSVSEVNSGTSETTYNGFGEVVSSENAKGQFTYFTYDALGRQTSVVKPEGAYYSYYDHARGSGLGQPWKTTGPNGYEEEISYDSFGRPALTRKTQFGETFTTATTYDVLGRTVTSTDAGGLVTLNGYDPVYSFPVSLTLAGGAPGASIVGAGTVLWAAGTYDSSGRMLTQTLAQGVETSAAYRRENGDVERIYAEIGGQPYQDKNYVWEGRGNLFSRHDALNGRYETFTNDSLNRLTHATVSHSGGSAVTDRYTYDPLGNLLTKGTYDHQDNLLSQGATMTYGPSGGARPHAVQSATVKGFNRTYTYDAAGFLINDSKRIYTWTSFGQLATLSYASAPKLNGLGGAPILDNGNIFVSFDFDAGGNRARQVKERLLYPSTDSETETTLYLGSYERETHVSEVGAATPTTKTIHRHSLGSVIYTRTEGALGTSVKLTTLLKDSLGSTDVLLVGTWGGSAFLSPVAENQSFDPWGERRNNSDWSKARTADADPYLTSEHDYDRGYTGHEQLDDTGLIHMNGRIYDPEIGRMLSPDPFVQIPEFSQNFNRYSYVLNNPLNATDPSGYLLLSKLFHKKMEFLKENWRTVVVIVVVAVVTYFSFGTLSNAAGYWGAAILGSTASAAAGATVTAAVGGAFLGAVSGGLGAALNGGDLGDILRGAAIGAVQGAITAGVLHNMTPADAGFNVKTALHVAGHGVVGGAYNAAMGGSFQDGFISSAVSAAAADAGAFDFGSGSWGVAGRTAAAGIVGGAASVIGGGKFANGAFTAAFQHYLNAEGGVRSFLPDWMPGSREYPISQYLDEVRDVYIGEAKGAAEHFSMGLYEAQYANEMQSAGGWIGENLAAAGELVASGGSAALKTAAKNRIAGMGRAQIKALLKNDRRLLDRALGGVVGDGKDAHHRMALLGHNLKYQRAMFPSIGLPSAVRNSAFNGKLMSPSTHAAYHNIAGYVEKIGAGIGIGGWLGGGRSGMTFYRD